MSESEEAVEFGRYRLLPSQRLLVEGVNPVPLGGRAFDILMALVDRRSEVVSKDELMRRVWGRQIVEENTLAVHLSALRKALGDGEQGIRYIGTVPGRGYQFVAPIKTVRAGMGTTTSPEPVISGKLPRAAVPLIGREEVLSEVVSAIGSAPLVTLTGPGGIGKTRLVLAVGEHMTSLNPDEVRWVDLTAVSDPALVVGTVGRALGIQLGDTSPLPQLMAGLKGKRLLLILDNCEHVAAPVAELCVAIRNHPEIRLLVTSQEPLGVAGEQVERLEPLALPEVEVSAAEAMVAPAVQLFAERVRSVAPRFSVDDSNVQSVVAICRRLEGLPLALELAGARAALLGVESVALRLDKRLLELSGGRRDVLPKHQTLRALLDWSHSLLSTAERVVLRRLAIFVTGCTLEAAEAVASGGIVSDWEVAAHLASLISKSLLIAERTTLGARYRLLETTRVYAAEQLAASGEKTTVSERHAQHFAALFDKAEDAFQRTPDPEWLRLYAPELDNVRVALNFALADARYASNAIALAATSAIVFERLGLYAEIRHYTDQAIAAVTDDTPRPAVAELLRRAATLRTNFDRPRALALAEQSAALFQEVGDHKKRATVLATVGAMRTVLGQLDAASATLHEAYGILSQANLPKSLMTVTVNLGNLNFVTNQPAEAEKWYLRTIELARALKQFAAEGMALVNLAEVEFRLGRADRAISLSNEAIDCLRRLGRREYLAAALLNLTAYLLLRGDVAAARPIGAEVFIMLREMGGLFLRLCFEECALIAALDDRHSAAAKVAGFTNVALTRSGEVREGVEQQVYDRLMNVLQTALPPALFQSYADEGAQWTEERAIVFTAEQIIAS